MPEEVSKDSVILRLQAECFPRRIRPIEYFKDFDSLRKFQVTESQFLRSLNLLMPTLSNAEVELLVSEYRLANGFVNYYGLCEEIEKVFSTKNLELYPTLSVTKPGAQVGAPGTVAPGQQSPSALPPLDDEMHAILHRVALLNKTRGIVMKYCFEDADRGDSASLTVRRRAGKVTESQFRRCFPLSADFSQEEIARIVERYKEPSGDINYRALHDEVTDPVDVVRDAPVPTSNYIIPEEIINETWSNANYSIVERVTAKVIERRVRLVDYFQDFDPLRKGECTVGQLDTVLSILGLKFTPKEVGELKAIYQKRDLNLTMFSYAKFCDDVSKATTYADIHKDPLARITLPGPESTMPARRSQRELSAREKAQIEEIEADIRSRVQKRRILFVNQFKDFDRTNQGHVTIAQFARVLASLGLDNGQQDNSQTELLGKKYCDLGSRTYFNYRDFCAVCDPVPGSLKLAENQSKQPYEKPSASRYFDKVGKVFDVTDGNFK